MKSWMSWKICRRWRHIIPSGMACATRWRATIRPPRQHNPLSQQKEFRAIKNAIIQEAGRLRQQMEQAQRTSEQESSQGETTP